MHTIKHLIGNSPNIVIEIDSNGKWIAIQELPNGKFFTNKGLIRAAYALAINANPDITGQEKAAYLQRDITQ